MKFPWNNEKPNEPFFNVHPWFIMKICHEAFKFKQINYFTNNQYVNRKKFTTGKYFTDKYIRVIGQFLKNWTDGNKTMTDIMRISIYIICNTNYDNSLYRLFHVIPADAKIDESVTKKIFSDVSISCDMLQLSLLLWWNQFFIIVCIRISIPLSKTPPSSSLLSYP